MEDWRAVSSRVNDLGMKVHTLEHQVSAMAKIPERLVIVEQKVDQLGELSAKIDSQNQTLVNLRDLVLTTQAQLRNYVAGVSGIGAALVFLITYGERIMKFLGRGGAI